MNLTRYCPVCGIDTDDSLSHFLTAHPDSPVPRDIVLIWVCKDPTRCPACYQVFDDVGLHFQSVHVTSVRVDLGELGYCEEIRRGRPNEKFACPWCRYESYGAWDFEVRARPCPTMLP